MNVHVVKMLEISPVMSLYDVKHTHAFLREYSGFNHPWWTHHCGLSNVLINLIFLTDGSIVLFYHLSSGQPLAAYEWLLPLVVHVLFLAFLVPAVHQLQRCQVLPQNCQNFVGIFQLISWFALCFKWRGFLMLVQPLNTSVQNHVLLCKEHGVFLMFQHSIYKTEYCWLNSA